MARPIRRVVHSPFMPVKNALMPILPDIINPLPLPPAPPSERFFEIEDFPAPMDYEALFGVRAPVEIEIGCGNGRYLRRAAAERPGHLFIGIEKSLRYARKARDRMIKYGVGNARIILADAVRFLEDRIPVASTHALHIYFPDPWPKSRHAKRRLFQTPFLETAHRILKPGGRIFVKVDLFWYFEEIFSRFENASGFRVVANGSETDTRRSLDEITGFEQKALGKKGAVFFLTAERETAPPPEPSAGA